MNEADHIINSPFIWYMSLLQSTFQSSFCQGSVTNRLLPRCVRHQHRYERSTRVALACSLPQSRCKRGVFWKLHDTDWILQPNRFHESKLKGLDWKRDNFTKPILEHVRGLLCVLCVTSISRFFYVSNCVVFHSEFQRKRLKCAWFCLWFESDVKLETKINKTKNQTVMFMRIKMYLQQRNKQKQ